MKRIVFFLAWMIFGSSTLVFGQGTWTLQTNPTTSPGVSMQFVSVTEGWISLDSNQLLHTTNGGINWNIVTPNSTDVTWGADAPGSRISFISPTTGWVIKTFGNIDNTPLGAVLYKTTNGGNTWTKTVLSNTFGDLGVKVQFVDANNGWILLYNMSTDTPTFLKTTDGGTTWVPTNGGGIFYYLNSTTGYSFAAGPNLPPPYTISKTTNGGATWTTLYTDSTPGGLTAMQFLDINQGWVVGDNGKIMKTTNGGTTWTSTTPPGSENYNDLLVNFVDSNTGWISARDNNLFFMLHTTNGGNTWTQQLLPFSSRVYSAYFWDANNGWAASDWNSTSPAQIARYTNTGLGVSTVINEFNEFAVYPNPNNGTFRFRVESLNWPLQIEIYDTAGRKVFTKNVVVREDNVVVFNPQNNGLYFVAVKDGEKIYHKKIIVKKE
ncbi:MAG: T9SS type A sorting domain-containing protein [Weeksellaceae bacterium]|nr:T9SS type A sorting domain-containing protein [Weeksellaceae bacterium]